MCRCCYIKGASVDLSPSLLGRRKKNVHETANRVCRSDFVDRERDMFCIFMECCGFFCCDGSVMRNIMTEIDL